MSTDNSVKAGDIIDVVYEDREFRAIVIDPNGLGSGEASIGFGFRMAERYIGLSRQTLSKRVVSIDGDEWFKAPSGKRFRVSQLLGDDNNVYKVIEASDWFDLSMDLLLNPGQIRKPAREKIGEFLRWFAIKGFYAESYVVLKGVYNAKSSKATTRWLIRRESGKVARRTYTDLFNELNVHQTAYGKYTNRVYEGLFGMSAAEMRQEWDTMAGASIIARNHISEEEGLEAVKFCEDMVVRMYVDNLDEAHDDAIRLTIRKFRLHPQWKR